MIVVSNASPLILLAKAQCLDVLSTTFERVHVSTEVYKEITERGSSRPGAMAVRDAQWISVGEVKNIEALARLQREHPLGLGELATIQLAQELRAGLAIIDERAARMLARQLGVKVSGCIGVLEIAHRQGRVSNLRQAYIRLVENGLYIDRAILNRSLASFGLPPL